MMTQVRRWLCIGGCAVFLLVWGWYVGRVLRHLGL